jgi:tetratricopeptide (TPR) repeat protein
MNMRLKPLVSAALLVSLLAGCGGPEDRASAYLDKAHDLFEERNLVKANLEVRNALQIQENNTAAWLLLARIQEATKDYQGAFGSYNKALGLDENLVEALLGRGQIYLAAGRLDEARKDATKAEMLAGAQSGVLFLKAGLASAEGESDQARDLANASFEADQNNHRARILLALLTAEGDDLEGAQKLLDDGLRQLPEHVEMWQAKALLAREAEDTDSEIEILQKLVELEPESTKPLYRLAGSLVRADRPGEAEALLRARLEEAPTEEETATLLADLLVGRESDPAIRHQTIRQLIAAYPQARNLPFLLVRSQLVAGEQDEAKQALRAIIEEYGLAGDGLKARKQLAAILLAAGERDEAASLITEVLEENPRDGEALTARAALALLGQDVDAAIADLRIVLADRPTSKRASDLLVRAYLAKGSVDQAVDQLERFIQNAPKERASYLALSELYERLGRPEDSGRTLKRLSAAFPGDIFALRNLSEIALRGADPVAALEYAEQLRDAHPDKAEGHYAIGLVLQASGDHQQAIGSFERSLQIKGDAIEPLTAMVRSRLAQGRATEAAADLERRLADNPSHFVAMNLLGEMRYRAKRFDEAKALFEKASSINPAWVVPYINGAQALTAQARNQDAVDLLREAKATTDGNALITRQLAIMLERSGDYTGAIAEYEEILSGQPGAADAANNLAVLLATHGDDANDIDRAYELVKQFADSANPLYRNTLGWVLLKRGAIEEALPHLEFAADGNSTRGELQYHLGIAYAKLGRETDARIRLERAVSAKQDFPGIEEARKMLRTL